MGKFALYLFLSMRKSTKARKSKTFTVRKSKTFTVRKIEDVHGKEGDKGGEVDMQRSVRILRKVDKGEEVKDVHCQEVEDVNGDEVEDVHGEEGDMPRSVRIPRILRKIARQISPA